jgi:hypothetical protein
MVAKQKGGVGATTIARELGVAAAAAGNASSSWTWTPGDTARLVEPAH